MSIEKILYEHELVWDESGSWAVCDCGRHPYPQSLAPDDIPAAHRVHLAGLIREALTGDASVETVAIVLHDRECPCGDIDNHTDGEPYNGDAIAVLAVVVETLGGE